MKKFCLQFAAVILIIAAGCRKPNDISQQPQPPVPPAPAPAVLLKDVIAHRLPSPYYHFEYDNQGRVSFASFASGFNMYNIIYEGNRISEMRNNIIVNKDRLQYSYDNEGRVNAIDIADSTGRIYAKNHFTYEGQKLIKFERERLSGSVFILDRTLTMTYYADGNLELLSTQYPATIFNNHQEYNFTVRFEQYDDKFNTNDFDLLHPEFFDHVILLPGVQLQKNNPRKQIGNGDGDDYTVNYTYTYNSHKAPLTKTGEFVYTSGVNAGQVFRTSTEFTYY